MLVSAMIRRVQSAGGFATVLQRGDDQAGAIWVECADRGQTQLLLERTTGLEGQDQWRIADSHPDAEPDRYREKMDRRRRSDPDLWIIELDIADAARFAAETIGMG
jgi:hypothetical protein